MAIFPTLGSPKRGAGILSRLDRALSESTSEARLNVLIGVSLTRRLKGGAKAAIENCRGDIDCVAKLGKRARSDEVLFARAVPRSVGGIKVVLVVVDVSTSAVARKSTLEIASKAEVRSALAASFKEIFRTDPPESLATDTDTSGASAEEPGPDWIGIELEPLPPLEAPPGPKDPEPLIVSSPPAIEEPKLTIGPPEAATMQRNTAAVAATDPGIPDFSAELPLESERTPWLFYSGVGLASLGGIAAGGGLFQGIQSIRHFNIANDPVTNQPRVLSMRNRSWDEADRANLLYMIGGGMAVAGAVLIVIDRVFSSPPEASVAVSTDGTGAMSITTFQTLILTVNW